MLWDARKDESVFGARRKANKTNRSENKTRVDQVLLLWFMLEIQGNFLWVHIGAANSRNSPLLLHRLVKASICIISIQLLLSYPYFCRIREIACTWSVSVSHLCLWWVSQSFSCMVQLLILVGRMLVGYSRAKNWKQEGVVNKRFELNLNWIKAF